MYSKKAKEILKENPFSPSYNIKKALSYIKEQDLPKIDYDLIKFSLTCFELYAVSNKNIYKAFNKLNFSKSDLIDFFFIGLNKHHINSRNSYIKQLSEKSKLEPRGLDMESLSFQRFETGLGNEISAKEVFERGGDVLNSFITIINDLKNIKADHKKINDYDNQFLFDCFSEIWMNISQIYSFNSFYHILSYEKGYIETNDDDLIVKIKCSDEYKEIRTISKISEIRESSHINEYLSYLKLIKVNLPKEKTVTDYKIQDGIVTPIVGNKKGKYNFEDFAKYLASSGYLENERFEYYEIELFQIYKILNVIEDLMALINNESLKIEIDNSLKNIPYKIEQSILVDTINDCTNISHNSIEKIIDALTDNSRTPYFWRKPFYKFNNYLYLSLSLLSAPNYRLLMESIVNKVEPSIHPQLARFKRHIEDEIINAKCKYQFEVVDTGSDELFNDCIIVELKNCYLMISLFFLRNHPIESDEINECLNQLKILSDAIIHKEEKIVKFLKLKKPIISIIIGNNKSFSGLNFNRIPYLDFLLLKNYFVTGEFIRARMIFDKKKSSPKVFNRITYYQNEEEFNRNLLGFVKYPIPIFQRANKIIWKEQLVFPDRVNPKLYIDNYDFIDDGDLLENEMTALYRSLNYQFYNNTEDREDEIFNENIQYYLTNIFNSLAFGKYNLSKYRFQISEIFQKSRIHGFFHLILYFTDTLNKLGHLKFTKDKKFKPVKYDDESILSTYDKVFLQSQVINLIDFKINLTLNKTEEKQLISFALDYLSTLTTKKYDISEINNYLSFICIIQAYKTKYNLNNEFYSVCSNIISALNFDNRYQQARNLCEEILLISLKDKKAYRGWGLLFQCLEQQKNVFDSTIYGCLFITSISIETRLSYSEFIDVFYSVLKFARGKPAYNLLDNVFEFLKGLNLEDYDKQKIHLSYFLSMVNRKQDTINIIVNESIMFYMENSKKIIDFRDNGVFPWLNYFYNLKRFRLEGIITEIDIDDIINELEANISDESKNYLQNIHFAKENLKESFINSLKNVLLTYSYQDFIYEIQNLELSANHLIKYGIENDDFDSILLSGFVFNDITLTYNNKYIENETRVKFDFKNDIDYKHLSNYCNYIKDRINIKERQLVLYLFNLKNDVYCLLIDSKKDVEIVKLSKWDLLVMNDWLKQKNKFYYDSKQYFDLGEQEKAYEDTISQLAFSELNFDYDFDELLISTNLGLSKFPINLLIYQNDFLASQKIVSNILSLEWFIDNDENLILEKAYTASSWIPIEDNDPDIIYAYDKLLPIFDEYKIKVITESIPKERIDTSLNVFLAHGELNQLGFKAIYKSDGINSAVIENRELIGKGEVAILFICNSGVINEDLFSNSVISLVHEIILSGYKTVIAPCWSLETTIPSFWLKEFLLSFNNGDYISESVFKANNKLAEYNDKISNAYYVPQGRLAMHLYGNPNIKVKK